MPAPAPPPARAKIPAGKPQHVKTVPAAPTGNLVSKVAIKLPSLESKEKAPPPLSAQALPPIDAPTTASGRRPVVSVQSPRSEKKHDVPSGRGAASPKSEAVTPAKDAAKKPTDKALVPSPPSASKSKAAVRPAARQPSEEAPPQRNSISLLVSEPTQFIPTAAFTRDDDAVGEGGEITVVDGSPFTNPNEITSGRRSVNSRASSTDSNHGFNSTARSKNGDGSKGPRAARTPVVSPGAGGMGRRKSSVMSPSPKIAMVRLEAKEFENRKTNMAFEEAARDILMQKFVYQSATGGATAALERRKSLSAQAAEILTENGSPMPSYLMPSVLARRASDGGRRVSVSEGRKSPNERATAVLDPISPQSKTPQSQSSAAASPSSQKLAASPDIGPVSEFRAFEE